ncbi:MAG TPA: PQQ-binding-like beta-propeller repeat protein [Streptosporangiaceae bacterium]|nr:PQQ-binding-like beta-propeller repeat protein [Streptosporangiaceae bacterium]
MVVAALAAGCSGDEAGAKGGAPDGATWTNTGVNVVSRPAVGAGVTAVTELRGDGRLQTAVFDLAGGRRLWTQPATMAGRLAGMGVQPPAVVGAPGRAALVAALEPRPAGAGSPGAKSPGAGAGAAGAARATLVARDARTGRERWARPIDSTFGPARCGPYVCVSQSTARASANFAALDPATGKGLWRLPGIAEVEWSDARRVVVFRMARRPVLEAHDLRTGAVLWSFAVDAAVGPGINLTGGWDFGALGDVLVGHIAPYQAGGGRRLSAFGFFGVRLADGRLAWRRPRLLRVYPSASPAVALITRAVDDRGRYAGFVRLDPRTGRTTARLPAAAAPRATWWLSFPADLSAIGFLVPGHAGAAYDLRRGAATAPAGMRTWSFCTVSPPPLKIVGQRDFYPVAALCAYDLATGRRAAAPGAPPGWYTGAVDGWRVWRDERGALHAVHDTQGTTPGMYGAYG